MDLTTVAVPSSLALLTPLLPPAPARVLEVGCGRGALAAALADAGYQVTGVDRSAEAVAATRERGVAAIEGDVREVTGHYDVVLFTRSLHHADDLDAIVAHAVSLLAPGGQVVVEEFGWERVDNAAAEFIYDNVALLVAAGVLDAEVPEGDLVDTWEGYHESLHRGATMLDALRRFDADLVTVATPMLWRLVDGRGGVWTDPARAAGVLDALRVVEERRVAAGSLPPVGIVGSIRP